jgi:hypothetical protein
MARNKQKAARSFTRKTHWRKKLVAAVFDEKDTFRTILTISAEIPLVSFEKHSIGRAKPFIVDWIKLSPR